MTIAIFVGTSYYNTKLYVPSNNIDLCNYFFFFFSIYNFKQWCLIGYTHNLVKNISIYVSVTIIVRIITFKIP